MFRNRCTLTTRKWKSCPPGFAGTTSMVLGKMSVPKILASNISGNMILISELIRNILCWAIISQPSCIIVVLVANNGLSIIYERLSVYIINVMSVKGAWSKHIIFASRWNCLDFLLELLERYEGCLLNFAYIQRPNNRKELGTNVVKNGNFRTPFCAP